MGKSKKKKSSPLLAHASVVYAAWSLLHMQTNGLLDRSTVKDSDVSISASSRSSAAHAIKSLEEKSTQFLRLASRSPSAGREIEENSYRIIDRFFATGLHRRGVVPPLLFACLLFVWFVEKKKEPLFFSTGLSSVELYDEVFLSIEEATELSWSEHIGAAMEALKAIDAGH